MKTHRWSDVKKKLTAKLTPEQLAEDAAWVKNELLEMNLRDLRELAGKTQVELAKAAEMTQGNVSAIETRDDHLLSKLRHYVQALGGELEVIARFGDKTIRLRGV